MGKQSVERQVVWRSDIGLVRENNEDRAGYVHHRLAFGAEELDITVFAVADGLGGGADGEEASYQATTASLASVGVQLTYTSQLRQLPDMKEVVRRAFVNANASVRRLACGEVVDGRPASTLVLGVVCNGTLTLGWAGDSRSYLIKEHDTVQLTRDHSRVQFLVDEGIIPEEVARSHPARNVILRALGLTDTVRPDVISVPLAAGDVVLAATDGLIGVVTEGKILETVAAARSVNPHKWLATAAEGLVRAALEAGGPDNVTVLLMAETVAAVAPVTRVYDFMRGRAATRARQEGGLS